MAGLHFSPPPSLATPSCSCCVAVFSLLLGAFGGFVATTILNGNGRSPSIDSGRGGTDAKGGNVSRGSIGDGNGGGGDGPNGRRTERRARRRHVELDDEGNPIHDDSTLEDGRRDDDGGTLNDGIGRGGGGGGTIIVEGDESSDGSSPSPTNAAAVGRRRTAPTAVAAGTDAAAAAEGGGGGSDGGGESVRLVVQRFRSLSLLLRPNHTERVQAGTTRGGSCGCGLLLYVSFGKYATNDPSTIYNAARTVLNLSVLTRDAKGVWGDGSGTVSVLGLAEEMDGDKSIEAGGGEDGGGGTGDNGGGGGGGGGVPVVIVPQANLVCKAKNAGKSIQYHGQVAKSQGRALYETFVRCVELIALEWQCIVRNVPVPDSVLAAIAEAGGTPQSDSSRKGGNQKKSGAGATAAGLDASVAPEEMFHDGSLYESWDDAGFPLTKVGGEATTKSARKKMRKLYEAQRKRHAKYLATTPSSSSVEVASLGHGDGSGSAGSSKGPSRSVQAEGSNRGEKEEEEVPFKADPAFVRVVGGTFGNLQALDFSSDMGPFCHMLNI